MFRAIVVVVFHFLLLAANIHVDVDAFLVVRSHHSPSVGQAAMATMAYTNTNPIMMPMSVQPHHSTITTSLFYSNIKHNHPRKSSLMQLYAEKKSTTKQNKGAVVNDGTSRGIPILGLILLVTLWTFTIPVEFRRAYICSEKCATLEKIDRQQTAPQCNNCVTSDEWMTGIKEYYANGGGMFVCLFVFVSVCHLCVLVIIVVIVQRLFCEQ